MPAEGVKLSGIIYAMELPMDRDSGEARLGAEGESACARISQAKGRRIYLISVLISFGMDLRPLPECTLGRGFLCGN